MAGMVSLLGVCRSAPAEHAGSTASQVLDSEVQQYNVRLTGTRQGHSNRHTAFNLDCKHRHHEAYLYRKKKSTNLQDSRHFYQVNLYGNPTRPPASTFILAFPK